MCVQRKGMKSDQVDVMWFVSVSYNLAYDNCIHGIPIACPQISTWELELSHDRNMSAMECNAWLTIFSTTLRHLVKP